jgi:hypothetical protein
MASSPGLANFLDDRSGWTVAGAGPRARAEWASVPAFARAAGWFGGLLLAACGLLVAGRRLVGAFAGPTAGWEFAAVVAGGAVVLLATEQACRLGGARAAAALARCGVASAILAVGLPRDLGSWTSSATPIAAVAAAGLALVAPLLVLAPPAARDRRPARPAPAARDERRPRRRRPRAAPSAPPGRLSQRQERYRLDSGAECIRGRIHLEVPAGARSAQGHIGFCPAFAEMPEVRVATPYDGVEATVAAAEVVPWGVRVECRLAEPAEEPIEIPVDVLASTRR